MTADMKAPSTPGKDELGKDAPGRDTPARYPFGPRPIGALVPGLTRPAFRKQSPAAAQLLADWPIIVGPALAADASPRRFSAGTLTLGCTGPIALELQHLAGALIERINSHLGRALVQRLKFVQEAPARPPPASRPKVPLAPVAIEGIPEGALRDALGALGAAVKNELA